MDGTQRTSFKVKVVVDDGREAEPVWEMSKPIPSPIITSSDLVYGAWRDMLFKSVVTWWEAPLSSSHDGLLVVVFAA